MMWDSLPDVLGVKEEGIISYRVVAVLLIALLGIAGCGSGEKRVIIGSKEFAEQIILREMMAALIESNSDIKAEQKFLGGTLICFNSLKNGEIDLYAEYTGTALTAILKQEPMTGPQEVYDTVKDAFKDQYELVWLKPLGFNNTYTLTMRRDQAHNWGYRRSRIWNHIRITSRPASRTSL